LLYRAISLDPMNAAYYYQLGKTYFKMKAENYKLQAVQEYQRAVALNPTNSKYHGSLAWAYGRLADKEKRNMARKEFELAIQLEPNNPWCHRAYAIWIFNHLSDENMEKGVAEYKKAVEIDPKLADEALKTYRKHQKDYSKLLEILPETEENDYRVFGLVKEESGLKFSIDFAKNNLRTYPNNAAIHFVIASDSFYDKSYMWEFTKEHYMITFKNASKNASENAYYRMYYGIHLFFRGEYKAALENLERSVEMGLSPVNEELAQKYIAKCKTKSALYYKK